VTSAASDLLRERRAARHRAAEAAAAERARHADIVLHYTTDDDGTHLWCQGCGWDVTLGFHPTVEAAMAAANEHRANP
jgi:hypothetical protein